jgi:NADH:ubiquinone oxidoreductase subunit F (NADH-binding)
MSDQAAGQCGPCINGLAAIADTLCDVQHGAGGDAPMQRLTRWISLVRGRGACAHPDGVAQLIASALDVFSSEFADHATHGVCEACVHRRILPGSVATQERRAA